MIVILKVRASSVLFVLFSLLFPRSLPILCHQAICNSIQGLKLCLPGRQCDYKFSSGDQNFLAGRREAGCKTDFLCTLIRLHLYMYGCFLVFGVQVVQFLSIKNVHTIHFLFVFKLLFEEKRGDIFGDQCLLSCDQKFILARQLAPILKS